MGNDQDGFMKYRGLARDTNLAGRVQANLLMVRMNDKDFIITGSDKDQQQYAEYWSKVQGFMNEAKQEIQKPERAQLVTSVSKELTEYDKGFKELVSVMDERNKLTSAILDVKGPLMEIRLTFILTTENRDDDMIAAYNTGLCMKYLLLARLYQAKFLLSNSEEHEARVLAEMNKMENYLIVLDDSLQNPERRKWLPIVQESKEIYLETFNKVAAIIYDRNARIITGTLDCIGPIVAADIEKVKLSVKNDQDVLGPKIQAENENAVTMTAIVIAIAILIGIAAAWFIARGTTQPLTQALGLSQRVEAGDLTTVLEIDPKDEIGRLCMSMQTMAAKLHEVFGSMQENSNRVAAGSE